MGLADIRIESRLLVGIPISSQMRAELTKELPLKGRSSIIAPMVFETTTDDKVVYCCISGGAPTPERDGFIFTTVGRAAFEALVNLPRGSQRMVATLGLPPNMELARIAVLAMIESAPHGAKIAFVGDMSGKLDGLSKVFNLLPEIIRIDQ